MADFLAKKVENWRAKVLALTKAYDVCPREAYSVLTKSVQAEWNFLIPDCGKYLSALEMTIKDNLFVKVMGQSTLDELERSLISLPARKGGLGITKPVEIASDLFDTSRKSSEFITEAVLGEEECSHEEHKSAYVELLMYLLKKPRSSLKRAI